MQEQYSTQTLIVWVSRHPPIQGEIRWLHTRIGDHRLVMLSGKIPSAEYLARKIEELAHGANQVYIVPVLPLTIVMRLLEIARTRGWTVLWPEMELVKTVQTPPSDYDTAYEVVVPAYDDNMNRIYKIYRFKRFRILRDIKMVFDDLP